MQATEATKVINRVFVLFPSFRRWFEDLPNRRETWLAWEHALLTANYGDCLAVLDNWTTGRSSPPAGFERDQTVYKLAREARDAYHDKLRKEQQEAAREAASRRESYKPLPAFSGTMKVAYDRILTRLPEYKAGNMTFSQWQQWCAECAQECAK